MAAPRRLPEFLRPVESDALLSAATCLRDRIILLVGLGAGLRCAEITHLRVEHVDVGASTIFVREGKGKKEAVRALKRFIIRSVWRAWQDCYCVKEASDLSAA